MEKALFNDLPFDIVHDILLRLPPRAVATSKCVCKSWLDLLVTDEFVKSYFSRSAGTLAILIRGWDSSRCKLFELEHDEMDVDSSHDHRNNRLTEFEFPARVKVLGSANGLILLGDEFKSTFDPLHVCNPISREYIKLHYPQEFSTFRTGATYGFGMSKISGQYKVVRNIDKSDCHVYTLGTGSWRRVEAAGVSFQCGDYRSCAFLNGNLHWLVLDSHENTWIYCFDLETECFISFSTSPVYEANINWRLYKLCVLRDCLCFSEDKSSRDGIIDIWLMKEYGVEKSWIKEYVINVKHHISILLQVVTPIKVFNVGDILMQRGADRLFYYSKKDKTTQEFDHGLAHYHMYNFSVLFTPRFLSLKSFRLENVRLAKLYDAL